MDACDEPASLWQLLLANGLSCLSVPDAHKWLLTILTTDYDLSALAYGQRGDIIRVARVFILLLSTTEIGLAASKV